MFTYISFPMPQACRCKWYWYLFKKRVQSLWGKLVFPNSYDLISLIFEFAIWPLHYPCSHALPLVSLFCCGHFILRTNSSFLGQKRLLYHELFKNISATECLKGEEIFVLSLKIICTRAMSKTCYAQIWVNAIKERLKILDISYS